MTNEIRWRPSFVMRISSFPAASVRRRLFRLGNPCQSCKKLGSDNPVRVDTDDGNAFKAMSFVRCLAEPLPRRPLAPSAY